MELRLAAPEDRAGVRQPRDHHRRQRAQVLLLGASGQPRKKPIKDGDVVVGSNVKVKVVKNKLAPPFREANFEILYGTGVNKLGELVDTSEQLGVVERKGAWYSWGDERLGQGRDKAMAHLHDHPEVAAKLRAMLLARAKEATTGAPKNGAAASTT